MKELARRAEAASKIQTGVSTVTNGNCVGHPFVNLILCDHRGITLLIVIKAG